MVENNEKTQTQAKLLTPAEAADFLGLKVSYVYKLIHFRDIPHLKCGARFVRFRVEDLEEWQNERLRVVPSRAQMQAEAARYCVEHPNRV
ncbi:MAG: helix-turn-helix domain-containing protein [Elusimicrobiaceae bacterium]|nr:helix-turn-helix domain-containing protein [Elusimicrobiaceae bacterium]MBR4682198.1 helix-turn-helix domain-containing protein [Elusimicrobiaceae bacterium]